MEITHLAIPEIRLLKPERFTDSRGFFSETYNKRSFALAGIDLDFVQDNHSRSEKKGTLRGLHFQSPPFAQDKLVRVLAGAIFDVALDIRHGSPTFGQHVSSIVSADDWSQLFVPIGFAHGFCTLEPYTEVLYKVSNYYSRDHELGLNWADPELGIDWPVSSAEAVLSEKDRQHPDLKNLSIIFDYDEMN